MKNHVICLSALAAGLIRCSVPAPELVVVVGTDYSLTEATSVRVRVFDDHQTMQVEHEFSLAQTGVPFSFAVVPPNGPDGPPLHLYLEVVAIGGEVLSWRDAYITPEFDEPYAVYVFLPKSCRSMTCPERTTCTEEGCAPDYMGSDQMRPVDSGRELESLCTPGEATCTTDGTAIDRCERFGEPSTRDHCDANYSCQGNPPACLPNGTIPNNPGSTWQLHVNVMGSGGGEVRSNDPSFVCRDVCTFDVPRGKDIELFSVNDSGSYFLSWSSACWGSDPRCPLRMDNEHWVDARFELDGTVVEYDVNVYPEGAGQGRVTSDDSKLDCPGRCNASYPHGTDVTVRATAEPGSVFVGWDGPCGGVQGDSCTLFVDHFVDVRPRFEYQPTGPARFDLDGDGFGDFVYAAPGYSEPGHDRAGRVYVRFGALSPTYWGAPDADRIWDGPEPGAEFGRAFSAANDVTMDGIADLVVGAPGMGGKTGAVLGIFGGVGLIGGGRLTSHPETIWGSSPGELFGSALTTRADVDGDGVADILVGAPGDGTRKGRVYIFLSTDLGNQTSGPTAAVIIEGQQIGDGFGSAVESAGDLDLDGFDEFIVGAPRWSSTSHTNAGRAYVFKFDTALTGAGDADVMVTGDGPNQMVGFAVTGLGDWQEDGQQEWAVSSHVNDTVMVFSGLSAAQVGPGDARWTLRGAGFFGAALGGFEDYTGDGRPDLVVGAPIDGGFARGSMRVYAGGSSTQSPAFQVNSSCVDSGYCAEEGLGYTVGPAGDLDLDGTMELAVGARFGGGTAGPINMGRILIYRLTEPGLPNTVPSDYAPWEVSGEPVEGGLCAAVSGGRAYWIESAQPNPR